MRRGSRPAVTTQNLPLSPHYYDSAARQSPFWRELRELYQYRDLVRLMVVSSITSRYKRSVLGIVWTLLGPLLHMAVMTVAFSAIFHTATRNYSAYTLSGLIFWQFFAQTTTQSMSQLVWGSGLLKRIYIPRTIFAIVALGTGLINMLLAMIPLALVLLVTRTPLSPAVLVLPLAIVLEAMFALGVGLLLSTIAVFFTDVVDMYQVVVQAWFYLTPVMYPQSILPANIAWLMNLNPLHHLLEVFRVPLYLGTLPGPNTFLAAAASAVAALVIGWWVFTRSADRFAYWL
jgi:ABC-type polysaccharide/polyol phosphate export permease